MEKYQGSRGSPLKKKDAQIVGEWLKRHGSATPKMLLEEARSPRSPLHHLFTWDNDEAAEKYRITEARRLFMQVTVQRVIEGKRHPIRAACSMVVESESDGDGKDPGSERRYVHIGIVEKSKPLQDQILARGITELRWWYRNYKIYARLFGRVPSAIRDLLKENGDKQ